MTERVERVFYDDVLRGCVTIRGAGMSRIVVTTAVPCSSSRGTTHSTTATATATANDNYNDVSLKGVG